jgi:hypothetical protein
LKLERAFSLDLGLEGGEIAENVTNSKSKLDLAFLPNVGLKEEKIAQNVTKVGMDACLPMGHPNLF